MESVLDRNLFFVREHVGMFKAANNFDVLCPESGEEIIHCREDNLGLFTKLLRFTDYKRNTPFEIELRTPDGKRLLTVRRGISVFLSKVRVYDENDEYIGGFKQKLFSIGGAFRVLDANDVEICALKGKWTGWDFRFMAGDRQLAQVTKKLDNPKFLKGAKPDVVEAQKAKDKELREMLGKLEALKKDLAG